MTAFDSSNIIFQTAASFINYTSKHLFLTGKAGTGKTTFLKYIKEHSFKKMAVVAPTGVAAINAGGVTIHSFFQIPPGTYLSSQQSIFGSLNGRCYNNHTLFKQLRMSAEKKQLVRELDLLIIDEVSMVRADLLDAMDAVLRYIRKQPHIPFAGVQVLYIGDLFQLPPVVANDEWDLLKNFYRSPFFFDAQVIQHSPPVYIELKKIYRQNDEAFISILNNIRNNCCTAIDLDRLHQHYKPEFSPSREDGFITLTTHNDKAVAINNYELKKISAKLYEFKAGINGEFSEHSYPGEEWLKLKKDAQVMFIKNDTGEHRRYYNGKIGTIHSIDEKAIQIKFPGETAILSLERETWKNIRYHYNKEKDKIVEEELGTFSQYPIRLAWAITIHKSQGLTFKKAVIDAGASFAAGQVYVALSRLTSLNGLVLKSRINLNCILTNERVRDFVLNELTEDALKQTLQKEQQCYIRHSLVKGFSWKPILDVLYEHVEDYEHRNLPDSAMSIAWAEELIKRTKTLEETALKFQQQLEKLFEQSEQDNNKQLHQRVSAACNYFIKETDEKLLSLLNDHIEVVRIKSRTKKYLNDLCDLKCKFERQKLQLQNMRTVSKAMHESGNSADVEKLTEALKRPIIIDEDKKPVKRKIEKGQTQRISLELFKKGRTISEISKERNLVYSTIEGHLAGFVASGEVNILDIIDQSKLEKICDLLEKNPSLSASELKHQLGDDFSYGQIKAAMNFKVLTLR